MPVSSYGALPALVDNEPMLVGRGDAESTLVSYLQSSTASVVESLACSRTPSESHTMVAHISPCNSRRDIYLEPQSWISVADFRHASEGDSSVFEGDSLSSFPISSEGEIVHFSFAFAPEGASVPTLPFIVSEGATIYY